MAERQKMQTFDWVIWVFLVAIGVYLGMALDGVINLAVNGSWGSIVFVLVLFGAVWLFYLLLLRLATFLSIGRFSEPKQLQKRGRPLMLYAGVPIGVIVGLVGALFGLSDLLL